MTRPRRGFAVAGIMAGMLLAGLDALAVGAVMPTIVQDIGGLALYPWAFTAYMLLAAVTMPLWGKALDSIGRRVTFAAGVLAFLAGSVIAAVAPTMLVFVIGRAVQGVGAGAMFTLPFAFIGILYPPEKRARAVGFLAAVWAVSSVTGPLLGTAILEFATWPWVFWINVPVGVVSIALVSVNLADAARAPATERAPAFDVAGLALLVVATGALLVGLDRGWLLLAAAGVPLYYVLYRVEKRNAAPIVPVRLLDDPTMLSAVTAGFLAHFAAFGAIAFAPLVVQGLEGSARAAGFTLTPLAIMWSSTSIVSGRVMPRGGERRFVIAGMSVLLVALACAFFWLPRGLPWALPVMGLLGLGMGLQTPALLTSVQNLVDARDMGKATSLLQFVRQLGNTVGIAAWGLAILGSVTTGGEGAGTDAVPADAVPPGVIVGFIAAALGLAVAFRIPATLTEDAAAPAPAPAGGRD